MSEKPMTVAEMARMGGLARAKGYSKAQLRKWGKEGGRPVSLDRKAQARLDALVHQGKSQAECAKLLGVSVRTIGRAVAHIKADSTTTAQTNIESGSKTPDHSVVTATTHSAQLAP
jgi:DNA invertase Pin-like site-specific DNA recombinase